MVSLFRVTQRSFGVAAGDELLHLPAALVSLEIPNYKTKNLLLKSAFFT
jgi:hypothetical protein